MVPKHKQQFEYWKKNPERIDTWQAVRFIYLSNFSFMSSGNTLRMGTSNTKFLTLSRIKTTFDALMDTTFDNSPYEKFFKNIGIKQKQGKNKIFIYCDPPYVGTSQVYNVPKWTLKDFEYLIKFLIGYGEKFMISEFNSPEVLKVARDNNYKLLMRGRKMELKDFNEIVIVSGYDFEKVEIEKGILKVTVAENKQIMIDTKTNKILLFPSISISSALEEITKIKQMIKEMRCNLVIEQYAAGI